MKLTFWGAARQVTGSMFLLEFENDFRLLVDCGIDMERARNTPEDNIGLFPFEPSMIHAVVITHAHIDHSGYLPNLLREGFEGKIYCTTPTLALTELLLEDSASLNQRKLKRLMRRNRRNPKKPKEAEGLYLSRQVGKTLKHFETLNFNQRIKLTKGVYLELIPAGHLLGAAHVIIEAEEQGKKKRLCFSGDIGRENYPLLVDPAPVPEVDYLICESTYGNRQHQTQARPEEAVYEIIHQTCVQNAGRLIVPAFSVGRTQAMLYTLNRLQSEGKLPPIKVFSDSPLAYKSTMVYEKYKHYLNQEAQEFAQNQRLFDFDNLIYLETIKQSKAAAHHPEPCMIISSSGMIQGGRIEHHVKENLRVPSSTILMIGYAAEGTIGRDLIDGASQIEGHKKAIEVKANIESIDVFSGHGDLEDLIRFVKWQDPKKLKKVFLVHGDIPSMQGFQQTLRDLSYESVEMPTRGQSYEL